MGLTLAPTLTDTPTQVLAFVTASPEFRNGAPHLLGATLAQAELLTLTLNPNPNPNPKPKPKPNPNPNPKPKPLNMTITQTLTLTLTPTLTPGCVCGHTASGARIPHHH